jgi:uncharacterized membrane protein YjjB (DUF3815 family)
MDALAILSHGLWIALFAAGLGVVLTAPPRFLLPTFVCGFIGSVARDVSVGVGLNANWATVIAAALVFLVAAALIRRQTVSPVVLICAVLPLGAAAAMFKLIFALMQTSITSGDALSEASVSVIANLGKVFATSLAIAVGLAAGMAAARMFRRDATIAA